MSVKIRAGEIVSAPIAKGFMATAFLPAPSPTPCLAPIPESMGLAPDSLISLPDLFIPEAALRAPLEEMICPPSFLEPWEAG
jgi:hypothetical protein